MQERYVHKQSNKLVTLVGVIGEDGYCYVDDEIARMHRLLIDNKITGLPGSRVIHTGSKYPLLYILEEEWASNYTKWGLENSDESVDTSNPIENILEERGSRYGDFAGHAKLTQELKDTFSHCAASYDKLTPSMKEAIDMIFHKLGRIGNGDPFYDDSWIDIEGYTHLVVEELHAEQQKLKRNNDT
jgi:hypothetical protein